MERVERSLVPTGGKGLLQESGEMGDTGLSEEQLAKETLLEKLRKLGEVTGQRKTGWIGWTREMVSSNWRLG